MVIEPDGYGPEVDYPLIVLLHGFGAGMHDLAGLCPSIGSEGYVYACPNAPLSFQLGPGQVGYGWMPPMGQATEEDAQRAVALLETFFDEVMAQYHVAPGRVILMGFSQGGGMTYRCGLPRPEVFAGLAALSSGTLNPEEFEGRLPAERSQPIFVAHGIYDDLAPIERGRQAVAFLEGEGYRPHFKEYPIRHEISQEVLDDLVPWIKSVLPPAAL